jgi:hypothetical protein
MYTTIEADIDNGKICGQEASKLPTHAHVLITLLSPEAIPKSDEQNRSKAAKREPHPDIRGKMKLLGDVLESAPASLWNLTA